jgi:hypothetical protein
MPLLWPRVRKINMKTFHRIVRHKLAQKLRRIGANYTNVLQPPPTNPVNCVPVIFPRPFNPQKISLRLSLRLIDNKSTFPAPDLYSRTRPLYAPGHYVRKSSESRFGRLNLQPSATPCCIPLAFCPLENSP